MALLRNGANVNAADKEGWTPLHWSYRHGYDLVTGKGTKKKCLHRYAQFIHKNIRPFMSIDILLKSGANIELKDSAGRTAFEDADGKGKLFLLSNYKSIDTSQLVFLNSGDDIVDLPNENADDEEEDDSYEDLFDDENEDERDFIA